MDQQYILVKFTGAAEKAAIISAFLMDAGFEGMEEKEGEYILSIRKEIYDHDAVEDIMRANATSYSTETIEQQNWNAAWESSFEPVVVENFAAIRASFHQPVKGVVHNIIITPKMSFGTGHHATTYLMIEQMQQIDFKDKTVIDFGTGTAVLAILAEKLGAKKIIATDNDEWSINNSRENIQANACKNIELQLADNLPVTELPLSDIVLANINLNVIIANLPALRSVSKPGATILFSGLMTADEAQISAELQTNGFNIKKVLHKNGWICLYTTC